ncbi:MAG: ribonuclease J [Desulfovibrio sp.]
MSNEKLTIYPLGGLGQIGLNCTLFETENAMIIVDCGLMFPDDNLYGVDIAIPNFEYILQNRDKIKGIIATHGHEDHIGALPWLMPYVHAPIYGSNFTIGLIANKLREHNLEQYVDLRTVRNNDRVEFEDIAVNFFPVCHSIMKGFGLGLETPVGKVIHTGDFKIDRDPLDGVATDMYAFRSFAKEGLKLLMSDSTNVEVDGFSSTEKEVRANLDGIFRKAKGRIFVTLFSSHIQRMQQVINIAAKHGRKVAVSGKSISRNLELAMELGLVTVPEYTLISIEETVNFPDERIVLLVTGSQGEPFAALSRIASDDHYQIGIHPGDIVLLSSRTIPGNEKAITSVINNLYRLGAEVLYERKHGIHASGHACREELKMMLKHLKPSHFIPVHGEYRHLFKHRQLAVETGVPADNAIILENGQPITFTQKGFSLETDVRCDMTLVDGKGVGDVGQSVLKERQLLAGEGLVVVVFIIDKETGEITVGPQLISRGFVFEEEYSHLLDDAKCLLLDVYENVPPGQTKKLEERVRSSLRKFFRKVLERDPVVVPLIISL